jgi:hypothetical protein
MKYSRRHELLHLLPVIVVVGTLLAGCGGDNGGEPKVIVLSDFEGAWVATQYEATSVDNPLMSLELISAGGAFGFNADDEGNFAGRGFVPAALAGMTLELPFQGYVELIGQDTLVVHFTPEMPPFLTGMRGAFTLSGNTLTIYDPNSTFDFDGDEQPDAAIFEGTLVKNTGAFPAILFTEDFEGHWEATGYTVTNADNPQVSFDTIEMGATFEFDVDATGQATGNAFIPAALAGQDTTFSNFEGSFELIYQDTMLIAFHPEEPPFLTNARGHFTLVGDTYTLVDENTYFDFDGDMVPEPAIAEVVIVRTSTTK